MLKIHEFAWFPKIKTLTASYFLPNNNFFLIFEKKLKISSKFDDFVKNAKLRRYIFFVKLGVETCAPVMFSGMTDTQWLRRLRLNVAWVIVLRVANSISVDYNCIVFEYFFGINWKLFRNCLFICKVSSYFKEFVYFVVREFQRISNHAQRIRNLFYSLGMNPILMEFTNCLV